MSDEYYIEYLDESFMITETSDNEKSNISEQNRTNNKEHASKTDARGKCKNYESDILPARADWHDKSTRLLIFLYKENYQQVGKNKKYSTYKKLWAYVADEMRKNNFRFTAKQIAKKWEALIKSYKDSVKQRGTRGPKPKASSYEVELDELFPKKPNVLPEFLADGREEWNELEIIANNGKVIGKTVGDLIDSAAEGSKTSFEKTKMKFNMSPMKKLQVMLEEQHRERMEATQKWRIEQMIFKKECEENRHKEKMRLIEALSKLNNT